MRIWASDLPTTRSSPAAGLRSGRPAYVLVDEEDNVVGRFNLYDLVDRTARVGYRVAQRVAGRGVATCALRDLSRIAREQHGLRTLTAATSEENAASQKVLAKVGFTSTGPAEVSGRPGSGYRLALTAATHDQS